MNEAALHESGANANACVLLRYHSNNEHGKMGNYKSDIYIFSFHINNSFGPLNFFFFSFIFRMDSGAGYITFSHHSGIFVWPIGEIFVLVEWRV